jgi:uncharacterized protein YjdB
MRVGVGTVLGSGLLLATVLAAACHVSHIYDPGPIVELTVSPDSMSLIVGDTSRAKAYPLDARHTYVVGETITWSSSNTAVASVDESGLVRGVAPGGATVKAQFQTFTDSLVVDVQP